MGDGDHISVFTLERLVAGELGGEVGRGVEEHLAGCALCERRHQELQRDQQRFVTELPYAAFRVEHERRRVAAVRRRRWRWAWLAPAAVAAAGLVAVWVPDPESGDRLKGPGVALSMVDAAGRPIGSGAALAPGATVQLSYDAGDHGYLALVGADERGAVEVYYPEGSARMGPVPDGARGRFPFALQLDEGRGVERFFLVVADGPEELAPLVVAARAVAGPRLRDAATLPLPEGWAQVSVWLEKPGVW